MVPYISNLATKPSSRHDGLVDRLAISANKCKKAIYGVINIHKNFHTHTVGVNAYFVLRRTNRLLSTFNYLQFNTKYNMDYCRQSYFCPEKASIIITKIEFSGSEAISATI